MRDLTSLSPVSGCYEQESLNRASGLANISSAIFQDVFLQPGCRDLWLPVGQRSRHMALGGFFLSGGGQVIASILRDEIHQAQMPTNMKSMAGLLYLRIQISPPKPQG